jgi:type II secretory pathway pseudopilin PulG
VLLSHKRARRKAAHAVECAIIYPIVFFIILGLAVGGMGISRYQQMAYLAREATRYASTHAGQYQQENAAAIQAGTLPNVNEAYIVQNLVQANAAGMDTSLLSVTVSFTTPNGTYDWDDTADTNGRWPNTQVTKGDGTTYSETNTVNVTITYQWFPEVFLVGPFTLSSSSVMPVSY